MARCHFDRGAMGRCERAALSLDPGRPRTPAARANHQGVVVKELRGVSRPFDRRVLAPAQANVAAAVEEDPSLGAGHRGSVQGHPGPPPDRVLLPGGHRRNDRRPGKGEDRSTGVEPPGDGPFLRAQEGRPTDHAARGPIGKPPSKRQRVVRRRGGSACALRNSAAAERDKKANGSPEGSHPSGGHSL